MSIDAEAGTAIQCARVLEQFTRHRVCILKGGYERFSACYHFLRTQKIFWMPQVSFLDEKGQAFVLCIEWFYVYLANARELSINN